MIDQPHHFNPLTAAEIWTAIEQRGSNVTRWVSELSVSSSTARPCNNNDIYITATLVL